MPFDLSLIAIWLYELPWKTCAPAPTGLQVTILLVHSTQCKDAHTTHSDRPPYNPSMRTLHVKGSPYARGHQVGSAMAQGIREIIACQVTDAVTAGGLNLRQWQPVARQYLPVIERHAPRVLAEMRGLADGAGLPFDDIYMLTCAYEHWMAAKVASACTAFAVFTDDGRVFCGQNNDELPHYWAGAVHDRVIRHEQDDGLVAAIYTHPGIPAYMGMNSAGLCLTWMFIDNGQRQVGLPTNVLIREFLYHRDFNTALGWLRDIPHAMPNCFLIAGPACEPALVEASPRHVAVRRGRALAHGNTVTDPLILCDAALPTPCRREARLQHLVDTTPNPTVEDAKAFVLDTTPLGDISICHRNTLASMVFDVNERTMHIAFGPQPRGGHEVVVVGNDVLHVGQHDFAEIDDKNAI